VQAKKATVRSPPKLRLLAPGLVSGDAVDALSEQVSVPVVPGVFLDHVLENPPQRDGLFGPRCKIVQAMALDGRACPVHAGMAGGKIRVSTRRIDQVELAVRLVIGAVPLAVRLTVEVVKPRFYLGHVAHQAEERQAGRRARTSRQLLWYEPSTFHQHGGSVVFQPGFERRALIAGGPRSRRTLNRRPAPHSGRPSGCPCRDGR